MVRGALAAALTLLADGGEALDEAAFEPYVDFLAAGGLDGLLALGTTGEGFLLPLRQRMRAAELFLGAAKPRLAVAVHCGAQSTADTVRLAAHAAEAGADGVAVIAPPYYRLDDEALAAHLEAAAQACAPTSFYLYEFERVSGYAVPLEVVARLRDRVPNLVGMKVSDRPFERVRPYLLDGLDVFIGAESLLDEGLEAGAAGAVSGLAAAFPELVTEVVRAPSAAGVARLAGIRTAIERFPVQAALKIVAGSRGVPIRPDVRAPLRTLRADERADLERWLESSSPAPAR
ncbi:MAG: dihydrodipicolinate synthase family protein [Actinobacteria bacterium]|nr:MAG: dihydrodipicolinate synthase family protein [Actinomycetota bacterium]